MDTKTTTHKRGKRGGKRGSTFAHSVKVDARSLVSSSSTSAVVSDGKKSYTPALFECFESIETLEDHIIPRQSITHAHHLRMFPQDVETTLVVSRQWPDLKAAVKVVESTKIVKVWDPTSKLLKDVEVKVYTTEADLSQSYLVGNEKVSWKSDKTLLRQGKPDLLEDIDFKRQTADGRITTKREEPAIKEVDISRNLGMSFESND